jgi:hypothetical protein
MADNDDLDIFDSVEEVAPSTTRLPIVIGSLVGGGLLIGIAISVVVALVSSVTPVRVEPGSVVCGGASVCDDLGLVQVQSLTAIPFPAGSTVLSSSYAETANDITVLAEVELPEGSENPLDVSAYATMSQPKLDWDVTGLTVTDYYVASGEQGTLYAEAVLATDGEQHTVVLVQVVRTL